jgi:hypothetical protein
VPCAQAAIAVLTKLSFLSEHPDIEFR